MPVIEGHCSGSHGFISKIRYGFWCMLATMEQSIPFFDSHMV